MEKKETGEFRKEGKSESKLSQKRYNVANRSEDAEIRVWNEDKGAFGEVG